jgi:CubicO group peptidase (beta-lactamase class C family)
MPTFPKTRWLLVLCLPALLTPITHGQSVAPITPQEAGLSSTALQQIDGLLQQAVERKQVAGAVALLARDGKIGYLRAKGFQDVEAGKERKIPVAASRMAGGKFPMATMWLEPP